MTTVKCSECGATITISEEQPSTSGRMDVNRDGRVDLDDFKAVLGGFAGKISDVTGKITAPLKNAMKSRAEKDAEALKQFANELAEQETDVLTESQLKREEFKAALESTIDLKFAEALRAKPDSEKHLTYFDAQILTASVRNIFKAALASTPPQVEAACQLSEAILAPSAEEKLNLIKVVIATTGGVGGITMVIGGVGSALGWGAAVTAKIAAAFVGVNLAGPVGWIAAGITLAAIAGYFATTNNKQVNSERFVNVLKRASAGAVDAIWEQHGVELMKATEAGKAASR